MDSLLLAKVKDYGFEVYLSNVKQTIRSVRIVDASVYIVCTTPLTGQVEVCYAGQNSAGNGNLRDSDPYQSYFQYIDLDKKKTDGSFYYPRDVAETTLRPTFEPKDANGAVIYNQFYPLYNFGVSFYYKLEANNQELIIPNVVEAAPNGLRNKNAQKDLRVYQSGYYLLIDNITEGYNKLELYSMSGKLMKYFDGYNSKFSIAGVPKSLYIAKVTSNNEVNCQKIQLF